MAKDIDPKLRTIGDYLKLEKGAFFSIPEYQRPYSWRIEQCDKLWNDIIDYSEKNNEDNYFFGTVILSCEKDDNNNEDKRLVLIDGQQRTTTFYLLFKALLTRINLILPKISNDEESRKLRDALVARRKKIISIIYGIDEDDIEANPNLTIDAQMYQKFNAVENKSINESDTYKKELVNILRSTDFDQAELSAFKTPKKQKDNKYTNFFRNYKFFYEKLKEMNESQLNTIAKKIIANCEIIEIRSWKVQQAIEMFNSLNSDGLPLEDADIISAKLYASTKKEDIEAVREKWKNLKALSSQLAEKGIIKGIDAILTQYMYYKRAKNNKTEVQMEGLRKYYIEIDKEIMQNPIKTCEDLQTIAQIWDKISNYASIQVLSKLNENSKIFLSNYLFRLGQDNITEDTIQPITESLQKLFTILELSNEGYSSKNFKVFLFAENTKIVDSNVNPEEIKNDFTKHINEIWNKEEGDEAEIFEELSDYTDNALVYLNEYLLAKEKNMNISFSETHDIEHIMPHSGNNKQLIRNDAGISSEEEFQDYINKLGNKIVLEFAINRSIGDEWFRTKVSTKLEDKTGYIDSKYPIANMLVEQYRNVEKPYWTKEDIDNATTEASKRIVKFLFDN